MKSTLYMAERNNCDTRKEKLIHPFDGRVIPLNPLIIRQHAEILAEKLMLDGVDYIIGLAEGGLIPGYMVAEVTGIPFVGSYRVRLKLPHEIHFVEVHSERAGHFIYGIKPGRKVVIIEDEITTGQTILNMIDAMKNFDIVVQDIGVYALNCDEAVMQRFKKVGLTVKYIYAQPDITHLPETNGSAQEPPLLNGRYIKGLSYV